jgi:hypothetical protein
MTDVSCADDKNEMLGARKSLRPKWAPHAPGAGDKSDPHGLVVVDVGVSGSSHDFSVIARLI